MGRPRLKRLFPIALSLDAAAEALQCPKRLLRAAVYESCMLPAYRVGQLVRVRVVDLSDWVATFPRAVKQQRKSSNGNPR